MAEWLASESGRRFLRHAPEILMVLVVGVLMTTTGFTEDVAWWTFPSLLLISAIAISVAYTRWGAGASRVQLHYRAAVQVGSLLFLTYATGWGPALAMVFLFAVADNVKYSGSRAIRPVLAWSVGAVVVGQALIAVQLLPSAIAVDRAHGIALVSVFVLAFVGNRIARMMAAKEAADDELLRSETRFRNLVQHASDVIMVISDARITYLSPSATRVFGWDEEEILGASYLKRIHPDDVASTVQTVTEMLESGTRTGFIRQRIRHADGRWIPVESNAANLIDDPDIEGFVVSLRDISERQELEEQLEHRAFHDALTGLANRALFRDRVEHIVARSQRQTLSFGVLYVDLDGFKVINDTMGHAIGDGVLQQVAEILKECVRDADTAARLGGDEFALLLEDLRDQSGAARVAQRVLDMLRRPLVVDGKEVKVDASIGIALNESNPTAEELLRNADIAMYMAKNSGKSCYELFEPSMHLAVVERLQLERDLQAGIERGEFVLHYQPIVVLHDGTIAGVEALIRWNHPERGFVSPGDFIPVAEESGLIVPIGRWVLQEACRQIVGWQQQYRTHPPIYLSVNVSMKQFSHGDVVADVDAALRESGLDPECLTLELTESALVQDPETTIEILHRLKALGVRLAVDDFGTGYSSLSYLQRFPVDILKIDRSFVEGMVSGTQSPALVRAIVEMGRSLKLETIAEGIEHDEELSQFRALQCNLGQGYLFARPGDPLSTEALLRQLELKPADAPQVGHRKA